MRQLAVLVSYCASKGFTYEVIQDLGSGMNNYKKGLTRLLNLILDGEVQRLVLTDNDTLLCFGAKQVFDICEAKHVEVVIINKGEESVRFEEELAKVVLEIITVFSARLYGSRNSKKLLEDVQKAVEDNVKA